MGAGGNDRDRVGGPITVDSTLIGRDHPVAVLRAEIARTVDSHGGLVFVTGEAGIGKTTLVKEAAEEARRLGALVLNGACWDSANAPGYWPWVQVVRGLKRAVTPEEWSAAGPVLRFLLGEAVGTADVASPFDLYDAVTTAVVTMSQRRPVVVVLDDLHWADPASLRLLEFAVQHTWFERLLVVGTYRDVEIEAPDHRLRPLLLPLLGRATTVSLTGLREAEVGALMARTAGQEPSDDLVAEVHRRTGGNPFFVEQSARLWHSGGSATAISPGVRDALQRRLSMLPHPVAELLTSAAVLGREFHRQVLAATVSAPSAHVDRLLDQAVTARLAVVLGSGRFAFAHDLVRETLYDGLDPADARRRHAGVVRAMDGTPGHMLPPDLAHHAHLAGDDLDPDRAVDLLLEAAQDASNRLAEEEGIGHLRRALDRSATLPRRWVIVALDLGAALHMLGETAEAWQIYLDAVRAARELDDDVVLARVAVTIARTYPDGTGADAPEVVGSLIADAHRRLIDPAADPTATHDPANPPDWSTVNRLTEELTAVVLALVRAGNDDDMLRFALWARHNTIWGAGTAAERLALTDDLIALSRRLGDSTTEHLAISFQWVALLEQGDPRYVERYHAHTAMAERLSQPTAAFGSLVDRSIILTLQGRFTEAEACLDEAEERYAHRHPHFVYMGHHLRWAMLLAQGRFAELSSLLSRIGASDHPAPGLLATVTALQRGESPADPVPVVSSLDFRSLQMRVEAQLAAASGDPARCERARAALLPHAGEWLVSMYGCDISGPADLWLALLDAAQERWEPAFERFEAARRSADRLGARPWSVEIRVHHARALRARDPLAAAALREQALAEAAELGMRHLSADREPRREPAPAAEANVFRRDGAVWTLGYAGRTIHFPDAKGLHDLHALLARPGEPVAAVGLLNPAGGDLVRAARGLGGDPVLDDEAKARYKRRLTELDDEIDRAALRDDQDRADRLARERDALLAELRAAAGLAGRTRRLGDEAERARKTVTARIRDTLRKLDDRHPELAGHLRATVSTGATCIYTPAEPTAWAL